MPGSVENFDRDLQFVAIQSDATLQNQGVGGTLDLPLLPVISTFRTIHRKDITNYALPQNNCACAGLAIHGSQPGRRVMRARGSILGAANQEIGLWYGGSATAYSALSAIPIELGRGELNFDATVCAETVFEDGSGDPLMNGYHHFFVRFDNRTAGELTGPAIFQLSVQDLGVAPPEYAAARR